MTSAFIVPAFALPTPADEKAAKKAKADRKKQEWAIELDRARRAREGKQRVVLGEKSRARYRLLYGEAQRLREKILSDDIRAWYESTALNADFDKWAGGLTAWIDKNREDDFRYTALEHLEETIEGIKSSVGMFADKNRWRNPLYKKELPEMLRNARSHRERRSLMIRMATPPWADIGAIKDIYLNRIAVTGATGIPHEVDHIVPIIHRRVCGLHVPANLCVIPMTENRKKSNKFTI